MWQRTAQLLQSTFSRHYSVSSVLMFWTMSSESNLVWGKMSIVGLIKHLFHLARFQPVLKFFAEKVKTLGVDPKFEFFQCCLCFVDKCLT